MRKPTRFCMATALVSLAAWTPATLAEETWDIDATYPLTDPDPCDTSASYGSCVLKGNVMVSKYSSMQTEDIGLVVFERDSEGRFLHALQYGRSTSHPQDAPCSTPQLAVRRMGHQGDKRCKQVRCNCFERTLDAEQR